MGIKLYSLTCSSYLSVRLVHHSFFYFINIIIIILSSSLFYFLFLTREKPWWLKNYKSYKDLFRSAPYSGGSSSIKPSCSKTELKRCTTTEICWNIIFFLLIVMSLYFVWYLCLSWIVVALYIYIYIYIVLLLLLLLLMFYRLTCSSILPHKLYYCCLNSPTCLFHA